MNKNFKLFIFQSNRLLSVSEEAIITEILTVFLQSWNAHGADLKSKLKILNHKFIVIEVDEEQAKASGCSMDKLNQCIRDIDSQFNLDLLNRLLVSFQKEENSEIETIPLNKFKEKIKNSEISSDSIVYNLSVSNSDEFKSKFKQPLKDSWANIYI